MMKMKAYFVFSVKLPGTLNKMNVKMATGNELAKYQNLAFPILLCVASMMRPIKTSVMPSRTFEIIKSVPTTAALIPNVFVQ